MDTLKIAVVGLGYVGLPLSRLLATKHLVVGYDININRVEQLKLGNDYTLEIENSLLEEVLINNLYTKKGLYITSNSNEIKNCNYFIVTVPTSVDKNNNPILKPLLDASTIIAKFLKKGDIVIYESTVYPGATEEDCIPVLEKISGMTFNVDFFVGYSPERINPGDKLRTVENIMKVTSGSNTQTAIKVNDLYKSVIKAGTHIAPSIKVAEASKIIENCQRDINIAFVNELAKIFNLMNINTSDVLDAAKTKWNFLPFKPGLVGGHCIGVDPFYLAQKAQEYGYHPEIILAGRRLNDSMGVHISSEIIKLMINKEIKIKKASVLILGVAFKENCPDIRNTKVVDVYYGLKSFGVNVTMHDPWVDKEDFFEEFGLSVEIKLPEKKFDSVVLAVAHEEFKKYKFSNLLKNRSVVYDVKNFLPKTIKNKTL